MQEIEIVRFPRGAEVVLHTEGGRSSRARVTKPARTWSVELSSDSGAADDQDADAAVVRAALAEIAKIGGGETHLWVRGPTPSHDRMAAENGLARGREQYQMRRRLPLPGSWSSDLVTRSFRPGEDEAAWLEVNNRAFEGHPEQGGWTHETLAQREAASWFDPDGFRLHERDGRLAGFCWTKVHAGTVPSLGEIYVIAVDPDFQGLGLGRDLTVAGLEWMQAKGLGEAMLYVDRSNAAALSLYRRLGFEVARLDRAYVAQVAAKR